MSSKKSKLPSTKRGKIVHMNVKRKELSSKIDDVLMKVNVNEEEEKMLLESLPDDVNWNNLNTIKDTIGKEVAKLLLETSSILSDESLNSLSDDDKKKIIRDYYIVLKDINSFTDHIKNLYSEHKDKSGKISSIQEYEQYNDIFLKYYNLFNNLNMSISAPMANIVNTLSKVDILNIINKDREEIMQKEKDLLEDIQKLESSEDLKEGGENESR
ncbi:MAG: hypothetical protein QXF12_02080 [Candidatus Aenigmatarchaeota archaeon]